MNSALNRVMNMRFDNVAGSMPHITELLREIAQCEEVNAWFAKTAAHYDRELDATEVHPLNHDRSP
jgi:hypothetical protein